MGDALLESCERSLSDRDSRVLWHPFTQAELDGDQIAIVRGEGTKLYAEDGRIFIDAVGSWWALLHGHSHPYISKRITEQLEKFHHLIFSGFTHEPAIELAERLLPYMGDGHTRVFYSDNGSTACEVALKMAVQLFHNHGAPRTRIVAFSHAYHGDTFGAMSVGETDAFTRPFWPLLFPVERIPAPVPGKEEEALAALTALANSGDVAAFIYEPLVQGAGGMFMYGEQVLEELLRICQHHGIITIADEVMTGFGRTGHDFVSSALQISPDIICLSKGLTGGTMALGATVTTEQIFEAFADSDRMKAMLHGHTFTANPLACTAGLASLDLFEMPETSVQRKRIETSHAEFVRVLEEHPAAKNPRQTGVVLAVDVDAHGEDGTYCGSLRDRLYHFFIERGVVMRPLGSTLYILPPYCITAEELEVVYSSILEALDHFGGENH